MATDIKIDKVETTFNSDEHAEHPYSSVVFATKVDTLEPVIFTVEYDTPDGLATAIIASPTVDSGDIVDFLP